MASKQKALQKKFLEAQTKRLQELEKENRDLETKLSVLMMACRDRGIDLQLVWNNFVCKLAKSML